MCPGCELLSSLWADQNHWQEWLNLCSGCESLSSLWEWQEWLNIHLASELLFNVWADKSGWTWIQIVSLSPVFDQIRTTDETCWTYVQIVSPFQFLTRSQPLIRMGPGCKLLFSFWAYQNHKKGWTLVCIQGVSYSLLWPCQKHWWEWLIQRVSCSPVFEQIRTTDKNGWSHSKWVTLQSSSRSEPLMKLAEHISSLWVALNYWEELNYWTCI